MQILAEFLRVEFNWNWRLFFLKEGESLEKAATENFPIWSQQVLQGKQYISST